MRQRIVLIISIGAVLLSILIVKLSDCSRSIRELRALGEQLRLMKIDEEDLNKSIFRYRYGLNTHNAVLLNGLSRLDSTAAAFSAQFSKHLPEKSDYLDSLTDHISDKKENINSFLGLQSRLEGLISQLQSRFTASTNIAAGPDARISAVLLELSSGKEPTPAVGMQEHIRRHASTSGTAARPTDAIDNLILELHDSRHSLAEVLQSTTQNRFDHIRTSLLTDIRTALLSAERSETLFLSLLYWLISAVVLALVYQIRRANRNRNKLLTENLLLEKSVQVCTQELESEKEKHSESEQFYRQVFENNPALMYIFETGSLKILAANHAFRQQYGYSEVEITGLTVYDLRADGDNIWLPYMENDNEVIQLQTRHKTSEGNIIDVDLQASRISFEGSAARLVVAKDITSQLQAQKERNRLVAILENTSDIVSFCDRDACNMYINAAGEAMLGISAAELRGTNIQDRQPAWAAQIVRNEGIPTAIRNNFWQGETAIINAAGEEVPVSQVLVAHKGEDGKVEIISSVLRDITPLKRAQERLQQSEENYKQIFTLSPVPMMIVDQETTKVIAVNEAAAQCYGFSMDRFTQLHWSDLATGKSAEDESNICVHRTGHGWEIEVETSQHTIQLPSGPANVMMLRDVTEQNRDRRELQESEERFSLFMLHSSAAAWIKDEESRYVYINQAFGKYFQTTEEDIKGKTDDDFLPPAVGAQIRQDELELLRTQKPSELFEWVSTPDGEERYWHVHKFPLHKRGQKLIGGIAFDITRQKRAEDILAEKNISLGQMNKELLKAKELAETSIKIKDEFLANTSHEIRNPLNAILGLTRMLLDTRLDTDQMKFIKAINSSSDMLMVVLNDILDLSKIEAGKMEFEEIPFQLQEVLDYSVTLLKPKAMEKRLDITANISSDTPLQLVGDPARLKQVLLNLCSNAVKFTQEGGISIHVSPLERMEDMVWLEFSVHDTGIGISPDKLDTIFQSYSQESSSISRKFGGTGLGLTIVKRLVELQSGEVLVESQPGEGSTFIVRLPFKTRSSDEQNPELFTASERNKLLHGRHALLVDDNSMNLLVAARTLESAGMHVQTANSGLQALDMLQKSSFDVILLDIQMDGIDGYETATRIRTGEGGSHTRTPILAMTASIDIQKKQLLKDAGINGHISKPFHSEDVFRKIATLLIMKDSTPLDAEAGGEKQGREFRFINLGYLNDLSEGNDQFVEDMISMFLDLIPQTIAEIRQSLENKDWQSLFKAAHKIKPSFNFIGMPDASELLMNMERSAKDAPDSIKIKGWLNELEKLSEGSVAELKSELARLKLPR